MRSNRSYTSEIAIAGVGLLLAGVGSCILWRMFATDATTSATTAGTIVNWIYTIVTAGLLCVAILQIRYGSRDRRKWETLQACNRYDHESELVAAKNFLRRYHPFDDESRMRPPPDTPARVTPEPVVKHDATHTAALDDDMRYTVCAGMLLNYFDTIAIGLQQDFYDEAVCEEHLKAIFLGWIAEFEEADRDRFHTIMHTYFTASVALVAKWRPGNPIPHP